MRVIPPQDGRVVADPLTPEVKRFINKHVHGVAQLELLLHLRDNPNESITPSMAARELRLGEEQAVGLLHDLHSRGLLAIDQSEGQKRYQYQPTNRALARQVEAVASAR
jgi:hypothetical protein